MDQFIHGAMEPRAWLMRMRLEGILRAPGRTQPMRALLQ